MRRHMRGLSLLGIPVVLSLAVACRSDAPPAAEQPPPVSATDADVAPMTDETHEPGPSADSSTGSPTLAPPPVRDGTKATPARPVRPSPTMSATRQDEAPAVPDLAVASPAASAGLPPAKAEAPRVQMIEVPSGTALPLELTSSVGSDTSAVEDPVSARVTRDVVVNGRTAIPAGSTLAGRVTHAQQSGKVKGVAALTVRFYTLSIAGRAYDVSAEPVRRQAESTKGKDAQKIGIGAGAGAVVGGLLGGRKGAAIGAAAGGAGGTGVVLATRGAEVRLDAGTPLTVRLTDAVTVAPR